ncbi:sugar nucleotide-binding protein [Agromyces sp. NPDC056379]|uniref:sugar nucleotide-binding protein n=1 Tax=unclassified Agromyces TaxID=2639701 RepID=UPI0035DF0852
MEFSKQLTASTTPIPGLLVYELPVFGDNRGWFKENWQREKMLATGLPDFGPVQNNISFNDARGTTRGIHAEPWDKFVSVATGRIFGAWVDLREGETFGAVFTVEIDPSRAVFVPRGVGNAYQTLEDDTAYSYLVNDHWSPEAHYTFLNLADETVAIPWPVPLDQAELSAKDAAHPRLADVEPFAPRRTLVVGAGGQLGRALSRRFAGRADVEFADRSSLDLTASDLATARPWREYSTIINAAAYTAVDAAETIDGRRDAWAANSSAVARLADIARAFNLTFVHVSSDYVFDGTEEAAYREDAPLSPLGVYGQTKAAGDLAASSVRDHYILRTSWVIGEGANFVRTMHSLAGRGIDPAVVSDQRGRLSFTADIADAIAYLLETRPEAGVYNLSSTGPVRSWAEIAREVFRLAGHDPARVSDVTTAEYFSGADRVIAPRPANSALDLGKIVGAGFTPRDGDEALAEYVAGLAQSD